MTDKERELNEAVAKAEINTIKALLKEGVKITNTLSISSLVQKKDNPAILQFMHQHNVDLCDRGGLFFFQSLCSNKKKNSFFLLNLLPDNSRSLYISIINYHGSAKQNNFEIDKNILKAILAKITDPNLMQEILSKVSNEQYKFFLEKLILENNMKNNFKEAVKLYKI